MPAALGAGFLEVGVVSTSIILAGAAVSLLGFVPTRVTLADAGIHLQWLLFSEHIPWSSVEDVSMQETAMTGRFGPQSKRRDLVIDRVDGDAIYVRGIEPTLLGAITARRRALSK